MASLKVGEAIWKEAQLAAYLQQIDSLEQLLSEEQRDQLKERSREQFASGNT